jgi:hypothetical protein
MTPFKTATASTAPQKIPAAPARRIVCLNNLAPVQESDAAHIEKKPPG